MTYDLRFESWLGLRRRSGRSEWGPPAQLLDTGDDPVVAIDAPRPDFRGVLEEFLVGFFSAALELRDDLAWARLPDSPPTPDDLHQALSRLPAAFDLDGHGPRFFQDLLVDDFADLPVIPIEQLLIETPGEQTVRLNKDFFIKRGRVERLGRPATATALLAMQTYAPAGGQGHRTSLRGGGPLTTLVDPRTDPSTEPLWRKLWANLETREQLRRRAAVGTIPLDRAFPWLVPTRTSNPREGGGPSSAGTAHPLEAYFGMPRRIRLEFGGAGRCDLTGVEDDVTVVGFRMRNYGTQYMDWQHPLTPHYRQKSEGQWLPLHGQPGGIAWRDWAGLALRAPEGFTRKPAAVVAEFLRRVPAHTRRTVRLHVFGYDFDQMKARAWVEETIPLHNVEERWREGLLFDTALQMSDATDAVGRSLEGAVERALLGDHEAAKGAFGTVRSELWTSTSEYFFDAMSRVSSAEGDEDEVVEVSNELRARFAADLRGVALEIFDRECPTPGLAPKLLRRRVFARHYLSRVLNGYSKEGERIYAALGVPLPARRSKSKPTEAEHQTETEPQEVVT